MSSIPLVRGKGIRLCSPVQAVGHPERRGIVVDMHPDGEAEVRWNDTGASDSYLLDAIALDLTDATGRGHAAMAVSKSRKSLKQWRRFGQGWTNGETVWAAPGVYVEALACLAGLADLDTNDDTRLPDDSRLVDALALAIVLASVPDAK